MISKDHLDKFKAIYKKRFGKDLDDQSALEKATSLLNLMRNIYKPMTKKEYDSLKQNGRKK